MQSWRAAGFAPSQLVLGVPAYAYISRSTATSLRQKRTLDAPANIRVLNDAGGTDSGQVQFRDLIKQGALNRLLESSLSGTDPDSFGNPLDELDCEDEDEGKHLSLSVSAAGGLMVLPVVADSSPDGFAAASFEGARGFTRHWDLCSSTPYLRSEFAGQIITFDDPSSLGLKAAWAREAGILGVNIFDIHGDTDDWVLVDSIRNGLGIN